MTVFCLAVACSLSNDSTENKPDQPTPTPVDGTTFTIPASGGTITKENLTLQIPSGTFSGETKISVTTVNKGSALNDMEASDFYKITLPVSTKKPIQVSVKSENVSEGKPTMVAKGELRKWMKRGVFKKGVTLQDFEKRALFVSK